MKKYPLLLFTTLSFILVISIYSVNFYFLSRLSNQINNGNKSKVKYATVLTNNNAIYNDEPEDNQFVKLKSIYHNRNPKYSVVREKLVKYFTPCARERNFSEIWLEIDSWSEHTANEIYPQYSSLMCQVLTAIKEVPLVSAKNSRKGTQLKLNFTVDGNQTLIFKPSWYSRNFVIEGEVYSGKDRHNSEIFAFYLGAVLNLRWTSVVVGRSINLRDVFNIADKELQETIISKRNGSRLCIYGKCFYCTPTETVCGNKTHYIEGALIYEIPGSIMKHKSPWQRTYKEGQKALWETENDNSYCDTVKKKLTLIRLLDLIDAAIFDFIIQNGDRHHYESRKNRLILIDNGKGFGNPYVDFSDILAPLYQCCILRKTTYARLLLFTGGALSEILKELTKNDPLSPIITDSHFHSIERRLLKVFSVIESCRSKYGNGIFQ